MPEGCLANISFIPPRSHYQVLQADLYIDVARAACEDRLPRRHHERACRFCCKVTLRCRVELVGASGSPPALRLRFRGRGVCAQEVHLGRRGTVRPMLVLRGPRTAACGMVALSPQQIQSPGLSLGATASRCRDGVEVPLASPSVGTPRAHRTVSAQEVHPGRRGTVRPMSLCRGPWAAAQ
jgi:hypothetical protein